MHKPTVVLINGKKRSGKDFCAGLLKNSLEKRGKTVKIVSIAHPLKLIVQKVFGVSRVELDYYKNNPEDVKIEVRKLGVKLSDLSFRQILQRLGTDTLSAIFGEDVWIELLKREIDKTTVDFVLVPDFRFKNEHISEETVFIKNMNADTQDLHKSENDLNEFKFKHVLDNTNYPDITKQIEKITDSLLTVRESVQRGF